MGRTRRSRFARVLAVLSMITVTVLAVSGVAPALAQDPGTEPEGTPQELSVEDEGPQGLDAGTEMPAAAPTVAPAAPGLNLPPDLIPLIDLHFHAEGGWDVPTLVDRLIGLGVSQAGNGGFPGDSVALSFAAAAPGRFIPFGGQSTIRSLTIQQGEQAWNLKSTQLVRYLDQLEAQIRAGALRGIGELYSNNMHSSPAGNTPTKYPADSPLMQRLWAMSATYRVPLSVHMEAESDSVAQMEHLLTSNRAGTWIWAHTGNNAAPDVIRQLLAAHPNLYCELSQRTSLQAGGAAVDTTGTLKPFWKQLFEDYPDRFVLGTDIDTVSYARYAEVILRWRTILDQVSAPTRAKIAHENAERLLAAQQTG